MLSRKVFLSCKVLVSHRVLLSHKVTSHRDTLSDIVFEPQGPACRSLFKVSYLW